MKRLLPVLVAVGLSNVAMSQCSELFFSEYLEGSSHNKGVEIYNPTQNAVDMSNYKIARYSNGNTSISDEFIMSGTVASNDVHVVVNGQSIPDINNAFCDPAMQALADQLSQSAYPGPLYMNGDDAITLETTAGVIVDIIGKVGEDPGASWTDDASAGYTDANGGTYWTKDQTLVRKASVMQGVTQNPISFNATTEWDSLPNNTWTGLGSHSCDCFTNSVEESDRVESFFFFPNPSNGGDVIIKGTDFITSVEVYNLIGKQIYATETSGRRGDFMLNVDAWNTGLYLVTINFKNGSKATKKLIRR
jgi:predicted extracellular nuclease